jgi:hypothetical protein
VPAAAYRRRRPVTGDAAPALNLNLTSCRERERERERDECMRDS